jgi:hypothetical protein
VLAVVAVAPVVAAFAAVAVVGGCASTVPVADRTLAARPAAWIALVPRSLAATPAFARLVAARGQEYAVTVVEYDPRAGTPEQRLALVRSAMEAAEAGGAPGPLAPEGGAAPIRGFVFIAGSPAAVPMGPWRFEGAPEPVLGDFALGAGVVPASGDARAPIAAGLWRGALEREPRWIVGRLPWDDLASLHAGVEATLAQMESCGGATGAALLCASGAPQAWTLASAREALRERQWSAVLLGRHGSCDARAEAGVDDAWRRASPALVVIASPPAAASAAERPTPPAGSGAGAPLGFEDLPVPPRVDRAASDGPPAVLVAYSRGMANPADGTLEALAADGWISGAVGFTQEVAPYPLGAAVAVARRLPCDLADGAPLGVAVESARRRYWGLAANDVGMVVPGTDGWRARVALSLTAMGDPAVRAARNVTPPAPSGPVLSAAPTVPAAPPHAAPPEPDPERPEPVWEFPSPGKWVALGALALFFAAFGAWLVTRRGGGSAA